MLVEFHDAVYALIEGNTSYGVWDHIPSDINEVPCVVVGNPQARETATKVVFDMSLECFVLGHRTSGNDNQRQLREMADWLWTLVGGTRARDSAGHVLTARALLPRIIQIAGIDVPAYSVSIESSIATC